MSEENNQATTTLLSGGGTIFVTLLLQNAATFLAHVAIGRILGSTGFGVVAVGSTLLTFATAFVMLGLDSALGRYIPRDDDREFKRSVAVSALQIITPLTLLVTVFFVAFNGAIASTFLGSPESGDIVIAFTFALPFAVAMKYAIGILQGLQRSSPKAVIENLLFPLSRLSLVAAALATGAGALGVAGAYAGAYTLAAVVCLLYLLRRTNLLANPLSRVGMHRELLNFSLPLMVAASMLLIHRNIDVLILGYFTDPATVGIYTIVYTLAALLLTGYRAFSFIFMPVFSEAHAKEDHAKMRETLQLGQKWALFASLPVFFMFVLAPELAIGVTFGREFVSGSLALGIVAGGFLTQSIVGLNGYALNALGKTRIVMWDTVVVALSNVVLNLLLIPPFKEVGAAVATAGSFLVLNCLYTYQLYSVTKIWPISRASVRTAILSGIVAVSLVILFQFTVGINIVGAAVLAITYSLLYAVIVGRYGNISEAEFAYLERVERQFGLDLGVVRALVRTLQS